MGNDSRTWYVVYERLRLVVMRLKRRRPTAEELAAQMSEFDNMSKRQRNRFHRNLGNTDFGEFLRAYDRLNGKAG